MSPERQALYLRIWYVALEPALCMYMGLHALYDPVGFAGVVAPGLVTPDGSNLEALRVVGQHLGLFGFAWAIVQSVLLFPWRRDLTRLLLGLFIPGDFIALWINVEPIWLFGSIGPAHIASLPITLLSPFLRIYFVFFLANRIAWAESPSVPAAPSTAHP